MTNSLVLSDTDMSLFHFRQVGNSYFLEVL